MQFSIIIFNILTLNYKIEYFTELITVAPYVEQDVASLIRRLSCSSIWTRIICSNYKHLFQIIIQGLVVNNNCGTCPIVTASVWALWLRSCGMLTAPKIRQVLHCTAFTLWSIECHTGKPDQGSIHIRSGFKTFINYSTFCTSKHVNHSSLLSKNKKKSQFRPKGEESIAIAN